MEPLKAFQRIFQNDYGGIKNVSMVLWRFQVLQGRFKRFRCSFLEVLKRLFDRFKGFSRRYRVFQGVSGSFQGRSGMFQRDYGNFRVVLVLLRGVSRGFMSD